jgi:hypothetical protein
LLTLSGEHGETNQRTKAHSSHLPGGSLEIMNPTYRRLAGPKASIWRIPEVRHIKGILARPVEYERRVTAFLDHAPLGD